MASAKKQKYTVVMPNLDKHKVGDVIELTEAQAASRVGKVVPEAKAEASKKNADLAGANKKLEKENAEMVEIGADLMETIEVLQLENAELKAAAGGNNQ